MKQVQARIVRLEAEDWAKVDDRAIRYPEVAGWCARLYQASYIGRPVGSKTVELDGYPYTLTNTGVWLDSRGAPILVVSALAMALTRIYELEHKT